MVHLAPGGAGAPSELFRAVCWPSRNSLRRRPAKFGPNHSRQLGNAYDAVDPIAVDKQQRRTLELQPPPIPRVGINSIGVSTGSKAVHKAPGIWHPRRYCGDRQINCVQPCLPGEKGIVELLEAELLSGAFRGERHFGSPSMARQRKVSVDDPNMRCVLFANTAQRPCHRGAKRALKVRELYDRDRGINRPE